MDKITVTPLQIPEYGNMIAFLARITQRSHTISTADDLVTLFEMPVKTEGLLGSLAATRHGEIKRFANYTFGIVGASRRFLAQIRTHKHNDFVSGSLQYSDRENPDARSQYVVPYHMLSKPVSKALYLDICESAHEYYEALKDDIGHDEAGYALPNGIRNVLIMQGNMQQWQYLINLRTCRRNSDETRYVMLRIWQELREIDFDNGWDFFSPKHCGCDCQLSGCKEGKMCCGNGVPKGLEPFEIIALDYPILVEGLL